jgi:hypothetical protein
VRLAIAIGHARIDFLRLAFEPERLQNPPLLSPRPMRVHNGKITEHWGVANLLSLMQQLGASPPAAQA